jgi:hypothetical protein
MADHFNRLEAADLIVRFLEGSCGSYEWDDFTSVRYQDPVLEAARERCVLVRDQHPPDRKGHYCNGDGEAMLRSIAAELRERAA